MVNQVVSRQALEVLANLAEKSSHIDAESTNLSVGDNAGELSLKVRNGLCKVLSGAATTEHLEEVLMSPLIQNAVDRRIGTYIATHARDERRHYRLLSGYLEHTFGFFKKKKSVSDRIFNAAILPTIIRLFAQNQLFALTTLYFFEKLSLEFYQQISEIAASNCLPRLGQMMSQFRRDEMRHLAGVRTLFQINFDLGKRLGWFESWCLKIYLNLFIVDISVAPWAIHNRSMRVKMLDLGLDIQAYARNIRKTKVETLRELYAQFRCSKLELLIRPQ